MIKALEVAPRALGTKSVVLRRFIFQDNRLRQIGICLRGELAWMRKEIN